jgi:hypothetical protein
VKIVSVVPSDTGLRPPDPEVQRGGRSHPDCRRPDGVDEPPFAQKRWCGAAGVDRSTLRPSRRSRRSLGNADPTCGPAACGLRGGQGRRREDASTRPGGDRASSRRRCRKSEGTGGTRGRSGGPAGAGLHSSWTGGTRARRARRRPGTYLGPRRSSDAATRAVTPVLIAGSRSGANAAEWSGGTGGPPFAAASGGPASRRARRSPRGRQPGRIRQSSAAVTGACARTEPAGRTRATASRTLPASARSRRDRPIRLPHRGRGRPAASASTS